MTDSVLDGIAGLGPARSKRLLETFGTVKRLRAADLEALTALPWLPNSIAAKVFLHLHADDSDADPSEVPVHEADRQD